MLKTKVTINNKDYQLKEGTYVKRKANSVVPRFANQALEVSDLTIWNWWSQSLWHGGFKRLYIDSDPPTGFNLSENMDVMTQIGSIKKSKFISVGTDLKINTVQLQNFVTGGTAYVYLAGNTNSGFLKLWRVTSPSSAPASAWASPSGGDFFAMAAFIKGSATPRLYLSGAPNFGRYLKYTTDVSMIDDTNWNNASGQPTSLFNAENKLWLINTKALFDYDQTTITKRVNTPDVSGNRGQQLEYHDGDVYWIGYGGGQGRLYKYDISAAVDVLVYTWPNQFEPKFIKKYKGKLMIGGKDWGVQAAALYEFDPSTSVAASNMKTIHVFENADDEDSCEYGIEYRDLFFVSISGLNSSTFEYIYVYNGSNLANYIKRDATNHSFGMLAALKDDFIVGRKGVSNTKNYWYTSTPVGSGSIESSKIDFDLFGVRKYMGGLTVSFKKLLSGQYIKLKTRIDSTTHWSGIAVKGSVASAGATSFDVKLTSSNIGKKIEYYLKVSGNVEMEDVSVRYLLQPENKFEWFFDLMMVDNVEDLKKTAEQMKRDLEDAIAKVVVNFKDIDGKTYDATKAGSINKGVIVENIDFIGPKLMGEKVEYLARVHLIEG